MAVTSGTVYSGYAKDSRLYVSWQRTGYSIEGNYSDISWTAGVVITGGDLWYSNAVKITSVYINGVKVSSGGTYSNFTSNGTYQKLSGTARIYHDSDGAKSFTASISGWFYDTGSPSGSDTFTLPTIPRTTTPTLSTSNVDLESDITIYMPRASSAFTHTLTYQFGSASGTIGSNLGDSKVWRPSVELARQIPNSTSGTCTITCTTYNGSTAIGSKSISVTLHVPSGLFPSVSFTHTENNTTIKNIFGVYLKSKSQLKIVSSGTGSYSSTIKSYKVTLDGVTYNGDSITSDVLKTSGSLTITVTVTDSRGRTGTSTQTITVYDYDTPTINNFSALRCDEEGVIDDQGTNILVTFTGAVTNVTGNTATYKIGYRKTTDESYTVLTLSEKTLTLTKSYIINNAEGDSTYDVYVEVIDALNAKANIETPVSTVFTLVDYHACGRAMAIGKVSEKEGVLEVELDAEFNGNVEVDGNSTFNGDIIVKGAIIPKEILEGTDLNTITESGVYVCYQNDIVKTLLNCPTTDAFALEVLRTAKYGEDTNNVVQRITTYSPQWTTEYRRNIYNGTFGEWGKLADYVVDRGELGGFFYTKWYSGHCELRGSIQQTTASKTTTLPFAVKHSTVQVTFGEHSGVSFTPNTHVGGELISNTTLQTCVSVAPTRSYVLAIKIEGIWKDNYTYL